MWKRTPKVGRYISLTPSPSWTTLIWTTNGLPENGLPNGLPEMDYPETTNIIKNKIK